MRISVWSSDVCSSDLIREGGGKGQVIPDVVISLNLDAPRLDGARLDRIQRIVGIGLKRVAFLEIVQGQAQHRRSQRLPLDTDFLLQIGRASCRERVCQYV